VSAFDDFVSALGKQWRHASIQINSKKYEM
jgi:hypothetical protein